MRTVRATHLGSGRDFEIGPDAAEHDREMTDRLHLNISGRPTPGREMVECREHDDSDDPELVARRGPRDGRVHGIYVYLRKLHEGSPGERWVVVHFDGRSNHELPSGKSVQHQREQDAWAEAADAAGYPSEQEVHLPTGVRCDLVIHGPEALVDIEVQRSYVKRSTAQSRTRKTVAGGLSPIWSTDHLTDWTRHNAVPHVRTNELPEGHSPRDEWFVVGGVREVQAEMCSPRNGSVCPARGAGRFCGRHHARLLPPERGIRVYEVAERAPAGDLVTLNAGRKQGFVLVSAAGRDLWHELAGGESAGPQVPQQRTGPLEPIHRAELRAGFGAVIDRHERELIDLAAVPGGSEAARPVCRGCGQPLLLLRPGRIHCERCRLAGLVGS
jgi:hypothetical protein